MRLQRRHICSLNKGCITGATAEVVKDMNCISVLCCKKMACRVMLYLVREVWTVVENCEGKLCTSLLIVN